VPVTHNLGVLVIHGMGSQKEDFADGLQQALAERLGADFDRIKWQPVYWADVLEGSESRLMNGSAKATDPDGAPIALTWKTVREFVVHNFGDALAYHRDTGANSTYLAIQSLISTKVAALAAALNDPTAPIVVMAHSLGAHMISDYIWDRQHAVPGFAPIDTLTALITFGCNIPLFSLEFKTATPINLPGAGVTSPALRELSRWRNYLDSDDVLGWPMRTLYGADIDKLTPGQRETVSRIEDYAVNVGSIMTEWNPASHSAYWTDEAFVAPVAEYLRQILDA
jgi:hypothetical protein